MQEALINLQDRLDGDLFLDESWLLMYSTDASMYREKPVAVCRPKNVEDLKKLILFAGEHKTSLIPRTAGTSLAGQVVGNGIVVDVSKYMNSVIELNVEEHWVKVQPGVVLDELNNFLKPHGLFFGPETSSSNRCMIGGMVGNNSCGSHSMIYGSVRDHLLSAKAILSDGTDVEFKELSDDEFIAKKKYDNLEGAIYRSICDILSDKNNRENILKEYPDKKLRRRNTGYAIDLLLNSKPFSGDGDPFNFCRLIAGSEGTLVFMTELKLNLVPLPPSETAVVCVHVNTVNEATRANLIALKFNPVAVELLDKVILDCTKENIGQRKNRFFIKDDPGAILIVEFAEHDKNIIDKKANAMIEEMKANSYGFHYPVLYGNDINKVWSLRKAGLGLLSNVPGESKPVPVIEDTAVSPEVLPDYIEDYQKILKKYNLQSIYYAHIGTGELHLRPVLNMRSTEGVGMFRTIAFEMAKLVKKYKGSLSGEHGDGRLRGEFIPLMLGEHNYELLKKVKQAFDPFNILNPGKIVDTPPMNTSLRLKVDADEKKIDTFFDFSKNGNYFRAVEQCNGSADCRKSDKIGGIMCPSYMATSDENHSTRARANILREFINSSTKQNPFDHKEIYEVMDLCLSCKGCKLECPSNIDMTKLKAEFLQHYYDARGSSFSAKRVAGVTAMNKLFSSVPGFYNFFASSALTSPLIKKIMNFSQKRSIPKLSKITVKKWAEINLENINPDKENHHAVFFFADEFTNYNEAHIGIKALKLLTRLGYHVELVSVRESARTYLSKGFVREAKKIINQNISVLKNIISEKTPVLCVEPSAVFTFRDEYIDLAEDENKNTADLIAKNTFMIDEFIAAEIESGNISKEFFSKEKKHIKLHGHCHQKSLASVEPTIRMLSLPENYSVEEIKSGCCGMAGSFGYEKDHYELSMKIGELILFPEIRKAESIVIIAAPGISCRQQIKHGTGIDVRHPVEIFYDALM